MLKMGFFSENKAGNFSFYSPLSSTAAVPHNPLWFLTQKMEKCVRYWCLERSIHWTEAEASFSKQQQKTALTKQPYWLGGHRRGTSAEPLGCLGWREAGDGAGVVCLSANAAERAHYSMKFISDASCCAQDYSFASCWKQVNTMGTATRIAGLSWVAVLFQGLQASKWHHIVILAVPTSWGCFKNGTR